MQAGAVELLVILGGNPVYDAPGRPADSPTRSRQGAAPRPPRPLRRRDRRALPLARARPRTASRAGATCAPSTAPSRSCSRSSRRSTTARSAEIEVLALCRPGRPAKGYDARARPTGRPQLGDGSISRSAGTAPLHDGRRRRHAPSPSQAAVRVGASATGRRPRGTPARGRPRDRLPPRPDASSTAASRTTAGCRSCPGRSPRSPGTTWRWSARRRRPALGGVATEQTAERSLHRGRGAQAGRPHGDGARLGAARARRRRGDGPPRATAARAPAGSAPASASTPTRSGRATRCGRRAALEVVEDRRDRTRSPARRTTGRWRRPRTRRRGSGTSSGP